MDELAEILGWPRDLLEQWNRDGVAVPDEKPRRRGCATRYSDDNIVQLLVVDRLIGAGVSLAVAGEIAQKYLRGCRAMEWNLRVETTFIWINLKAPADFVMLPDYDLDTFVPDYEGVYLIIPLKPIYQSAAHLIDGAIGQRAGRSFAS